METRIDDRSGRTARIGRRLAGTSVLVVLAGGMLAVPLTAGAQRVPETRHEARAASTGPTLQERKTSKYGEVLTNSNGRSLYVLSTESKTKLHCTSKSCLANWPPLLVGINSKITRGTGVKGKVGHVTRGSKWQVTFNGWPVYRFLGDTGPAQTNGERIYAFGGTWWLVHPGAMTNFFTPIK